MNGSSDGGDLLAWQMLQSNQLKQRRTGSRRLGVWTFYQGQRQGRLCLVLKLAVGAQWTEQTGAASCTSLQARR